MTTPSRPAASFRTPSADEDLPKLRSTIPHFCFRRSPARAWGALIRTLMLSVACFAALAHVQPASPLEWVPAAPLLLILWSVQACLFVGLFVIAHDCGHGSFSRKEWVNSLIGHCCLAPLLTGFHSWRIAHNRHHIFTQLRVRDPDWPEQMVTAAEFSRLPAQRRRMTHLAFGSPFGVLVGFWVGVARRLAFERAYSDFPMSRRERRQVRASNAAMLLATGAVGTSLWLWGGVWAMWKHYGVPAVIAAALGSLLTLLHHHAVDASVFDENGWTPYRGQVWSTYQVRFPALLEWLWLDINLHLPHHVDPRIPWYHLRQAGEALRERIPELYRERPFRFGDLVRIWRMPVLIYDADRRCYVPGPVGSGPVGARPPESG